MLQIAELSRTKEVLKEKAVRALADAGVSHDRKRAPVCRERIAYRLCRVVEQAEAPDFYVAYRERVAPTDRREAVFGHFVADSFDRAAGREEVCIVCLL